MSVQHDPMLAAVQDAESVNHVFGKFTIEGQFIVWQQGVKGVRAWIEGESVDGRMTLITMRVNPLDITGSTKMVERQAKSEFGDWKYVAWPSMKRLGARLSTDFNDKWVHVEIVPSGKNSDFTTFKFHGVFDTEAACEAAYNSFKGNEAHSTPAAMPSPIDKPAVSQMSEIDKANALQFLSFVVLQNKNDLLALDKALKETNLVKDLGLTVNSPEVMELLIPFGN